MKRIFTLVAVLSLLFTGTKGAFAQTTVPAIISSDQTWTTSGSPYNINQNTYVDTGVSITVMPGVVINSVGTSYKFIVNGEFQAKGTSASMITVNDLQIEFTEDAIGYDSVTGKGVHFKYCTFNGPGTSNRSISSNYGTAMRIEDCAFNNTFYGVYTRGTTAKLGPPVEILNCIFKSNATLGYPVYGSGSTAHLIIKGCEFNGAYSILVYGKTVMEDNVIDNMQRVTLSSYYGLDMQCNVIKNLTYGIYVNAYHYYDTNAVISITHNTFDSMGNSFEPMLKVATEDHYLVNYNNFLTNNGTNAKVLIQGSNPNPRSYKYMDFRYNYWVSTDSATIASYIKDYNDDITILGKADFSNYLSAKNTKCSTTPSSCNASFYVALDTTFSGQLFLINNSTGIKSTTNYLWTFGDGTSSTQKKPVHTYKKFGKYEVCLYLSDSLNNCSSMYCDSLGLDSNGRLLKKEGFTINILDESDVTSVPDTKTLSNISLYPNPGNGLFTIELPHSMSKSIHARVMDPAGRMLMEKDLEHTGNDQWNLDLMDLNEGMYLVHLSTGGSAVTVKVVINR